MSAPPGYNPEVSLLSGGTGEISRVMGGGGTAPPGFNETASLLTGGENSVIHVVKGGGDVTFANEHGKSLETELPAPSTGPVKVALKKNKNNKNNKKTTQIPTNPVQFETYEPRISEKEAEEGKKFLIDLTQGLKSKKEWRESYQSYLTIFKTRQFAKWWRIKTDGSKQAAQVLRLTDCDSSTTQEHQLIEVLPRQTETIIVVPPVRGDLLFLHRILEYLINNRIFQSDKEPYVLQANTVLLFMNPFFDEKSDTHSHVFSIFLDLYNDNEGSVFMLNDKSKSVGCKLYETFNSEKDIGKDYLVNLLNPSSIIYPFPIGNYTGLHFSNASDISRISIQQNKNSGYEMAGTLITKGGPFVINPGTSTDSVFASYLNITSYGKSSTVLPTKRFYVAECTDLKTVFYEDDLTGDLNLAGQDLLILRLGKRKEPPLLCLNKEGKKVDILPDEGSFQGSESNPAFAKADTQTLRILQIPYKFRIPLPGNNVEENWESAIFSTSEAKFLTSLHLTPQVLVPLFGGENWKGELAAFMKSVVNTNCFSDASILLKAECEVTRKFLNAVSQYFFLHTMFEEEQNFAIKIGAKTSSETMKIKDEKQVLEPIIWPLSDVLKEIDASQFDRKYFGQIERITSQDKNEFIIDMIVSHKKSGEYKLMRIHIPRDTAIAAPKAPGEDVMKMVSKALEEMKAAFPEFLFIY